MKNIYLLVVWGMAIFIVAVILGQSYNILNGNFKEGLTNAYTNTYSGRNYDATGNGDIYYDVSLSNPDELLNVDVNNIKEIDNNGVYVPYSATTGAAAAVANINYDSKKLDVQYHDIDVKDEIGNQWTAVKNNDGKLEYVKWNKLPNYATYYSPGAFPYGPSNYVPTYENSVLLSHYSTHR
jgi:hypothetical protein